MRASPIVFVCVAVFVIAGCPKKEEGTGRSAAGKGSSLQGLDPDGEKEVFGKGGQQAPPKVVANKGPAPRAPAAPAAPPAAAPETPPAAPAPPPSMDNEPAAPAASGTPKKIEVEYDEGVYPYKGKHLRFRDGISAQASTTLCEGARCHDAGRLIDHKDKTAWCEGAKGRGVGQWIALDLGRARVVNQIVFSPGYAKDRRRWVTNARPRSVRITTDEGSFIADFPQQTNVFVPGQQLDFAVPIVDFPLRLKRPIKTKSIKIVIERVWPGSRYEDMCISEIAVYAK